MKCPCCGKPLKLPVGGCDDKVQCEKGHKFRIDMNPLTGERKVVFVGGPACGTCKKGDNWPVPRNERFRPPKKRPEGAGWRALQQSSLQDNATWPRSPLWTDGECH